MVGKEGYVKEGGFVRWQQAEALITIIPQHCARLCKRKEKLRGGSYTRRAKSERRRDRGCRLGPRCPSSTPSPLKRASAYTDKKNQQSNVTPNERTAN